MKEEKHPGGRLAKAVRVETGWAGEGEWGRGRRREEETQRKGTQVPQYRDFILVCFFFTAFYRRAESGAVATHPLLRATERTTVGSNGSYRAPLRAESQVWAGSPIKSQT